MSYRGTWREGPPLLGLVGVPLSVLEGWGERALSFHGTAHVILRQEVEVARFRYGRASVIETSGERIEVTFSEFVPGHPQMVVKGSVLKPVPFSQMSKKEEIRFLIVNHERKEFFQIRSRKGSPRMSGRIQFEKAVYEPLSKARFEKFEIDGSEWLAGAEVMILKEVSTCSVEVPMVLEDFRANDTVAPF